MTKIFVGIGFLVFCIGYNSYTKNEDKYMMDKIVVCSKIVSDKFKDDPKQESSFTVSIPMFGMDDNMEYNYTYTPGKDNFLEYKKIHDNMIVNQK